MTIDEAKELFGYASWATALMLQAAEVLTWEQLEALAVSSFPSIGATKDLKDPKDLKDSKDIKMFLCRLGPLGPLGP